MIILDTTPLQKLGKFLLTTFFKKRISVLTGLKVSSLVRKCVFSRPERTGKWAPHGTEILIF